jgi:hypothetical protein
MKIILLYHDMAYWGTGVIAARILWHLHEIEVSGQIHAPAPLPAGKETLVPTG